MEIYNSHLLNNKQRFRKALLYALAASIGCAFICSFIHRLTTQMAGIMFPILYVISGYAVAKAIQKAGGGIGKKYAYMGAGFTVLSILLSELFYFAGYNILLHPQYWELGFRLVFAHIFQFQGTNILTLVFIVWGVYAGYKESDITNA